MSHYRIFTDGGSRGNPGPAGIGLVIYDGNTGGVVYELGDFLGTATNNVAEYSALIRALEIAKDLGAARIEVFADSELMIKQLKGQYKVKNEGLIPLYQKVRLLAAKFESCTYTHVLREKNKRADGLANQAMDKKSMVAGVTSDPTAPEFSAKAEAVPVPEIAFAYPSPFAPKGKVVPLAPGIFRETVATGEKLLQLKVYLAKGSQLPLHRHRHEQSCFILQGKLKLITPDGEKVLAQGQVITFPGNLEHGVEVLEDTIILDTFTPVKEEYLE